MENKVTPQKLLIAITNKSLSNKAAEVIRDMIIKGECPMGSRITETDFAEALGISRICIREAFSILENEGLVHRVANKYNEVVNFSKKDIEEIYRLRTAIELACLEAGIEYKSIDYTKMRNQAEVISGIVCAQEKNIFEWVLEDLNFHELIVIQSGNSRALKAWSSLKNQMKTLLYATLDSYPDSIKYEKSSSHRLLIDSIEKGDLEKASATLKAHIMGGCSDVLASMRG